MKKIKLSLLITFLLVSYTSFSQIRVSPEHYCIYLADKTGTPITIEKPEEFLSQKAIERRNKSAIPITNQDLPVNPVYIYRLKEIGFEIINRPLGFGFSG